MEKQLGPGDLVTAKGASVDLKETLKGKFVGLYFGAQWCGPCRTFSLQLVKTYNALKKKTDANGSAIPFEIVFVSSDKTEDQMMMYMRQCRMQFLAIPFGDKRQDWLPSRYGAEHLPWFTILSPDGEVLIKDAVKDVKMSEEAAWEQWMALAEKKANNRD